MTHDCSCREFVVEVYLASPGPPREIGAVKVGRSTLHFEPVLSADREALHRVFDAYASSPRSRSPSEGNPGCPGGTIPVPAAQA